MYDYPTPAPVQAPPQRRRRSGRKGVRRKKGFALWQWIVLSALVCGLLYACVQLSSANGSLNRLRLESARRFLRYSDRSLGEIAAGLGFSSQFHFTDFFKRMTGISPMQYRKEESGKNG